jgi:thiazole synthase
MELGADAVLVNTAIGTAGDPAAMADAFRLAVDAGRSGFRAGLAGVRRDAAASSPLTGFLST